jgi:hypothetical protein
MAAYQIETGTCHGRGFVADDPTGFLAKLHAWITKIPANGGPGWYIHDDQSTLGTDPYVVLCDTASPTVNDYNTGPSGGAPKFVWVQLPTTTAGKVFVKGFLWWDNSTQTGYGQWFGKELFTYDDADFVYDFRGGAECLIIQTRLGSDWTTVIVDDFEGDTNLLESATKVGTLQSSATAGDSVTVQLGTGEASNFTANKYYYIFDFDGHTYCEYVQCTAVDTGTDQITLSKLYKSYPSGAVVSAYAHRYYECSDGKRSDVSYYSRDYCQLPYYSYTYSGSQVCIYDQSGYDYGSARLCVNDYYLYTMDPNDEGYYAVQRPGLSEYYHPNANYSSDGMNRSYGVCKNLYCTAKGTMAAAQDGRVIGANNWLFFQTMYYMTVGGSSTLATLFLDTESIA